MEGQMNGLEGNGRDVSVVLYRYLPGGTEENHNNF
jgi:hypothetical protein